MSKENVKVICPICKADFVTSTDSNETQCPACNFVFELEPKETNNAVQER